jgi:hypothetical protein
MHWWESHLGRFLLAKSRSQPLDTSLLCDIITYRKPLLLPWIKPHLPVRSQLYCCRCKHTFLGAFEKLLKANVNFVTSVRQSRRVEQFGSHWMDFYGSLYLSIFSNVVQEIQVPLKYDKMDILSEILLRMRNVSDRSCRKNQNTFYVQ